MSAYRMPSDTGISSRVKVDLVAQISTNNFYAIPFFSSIISSFSDFHAQLMAYRKREESGYDIICHYGALQGHQVKASPTKSDRLSRMWQLRI